jgi:catechol 2,3-dioxygenase-like lactoylglutathione lyase family enzyme
MLGSEALVAFVPSTNLQQARAFYVGTLGLREEYTDEFALVLESHGIMIRVVNVSAVVGYRPAPFTILGWTVKDIGESADWLLARGLELERYDGMDQDERGVWTSPSGARMAWFKDPEGNVLSVTQV